MTKPEPKYFENELNAIRREAMEFAEIGLYRYKFDGSLIFIDRGAMKILGLEEKFSKPEDLAGKNISDLIVYTGPREYLRQKIRAHGHVKNLEYPFKTLGGLHRWALHDSYLYRDPETGVESIQVIIRDITDRKRRETELQKINRSLRMLSECNQILVRTDQEMDLLEKVTKATVEFGDYPMAAVGFLDQSDPGRIRLVRMASYPPISDSADSDFFDVDLFRDILSTGKPLILSNIKADSKMVRGENLSFASGRVSCIALPLKSREKIFGALKIISYETDAFNIEDIKLLTELADDLAFGVNALRTRDEMLQAIEGTRFHVKKLGKTMEGIIEAISLMIEMRDPYTAGHQRGVSNLAAAIAREMGLSVDSIEGVRMAAAIHDLGKISVPAEILIKPGTLNEIELNLIRTHERVGHEILKTIDFPWPIAEIVHQHHERYDGSGYPAALAGEEIMIEARILAVADVVEAMSSHRPYRAALGVGRAMDEISANRGILFDPRVVDACLELFQEKGFKFE